jgi:ribosomal protein S27E
MAKESKTGLWATAGTSLVGLVAASIYGWLTPLWTWLSELAAGLWAHLRASTAMPNWSIYLLGAVVCGALLTFIYAVMVSREGNYNLYVRDVFNNVTWRWNYAGGGASNLWPQCFVCSTQLVESSDFARARSSEYYAYNPSAGIEMETSLHCETCSRVMLVSVGYYSELIAKVKRQIHRKLETGEWKEVVGVAKS